MKKINLIFYFFVIFLSLSVSAQNNDLWFKNGTNEQKETESDIIDTVVQDMILHYSSPLLLLLQLEKRIKEKLALKSQEGGDGGGSGGDF